MKNQKILSCTPLAAGRHLSLSSIKFMDDRGRIRHWETAGRVGGLGAVMIIATLLPGRRLLLVRQFRPPTGRHVIEFPAGLTEQGETPEETAVRELFEETGYRGEIVRVLPPAYNSPGMSGETVSTVMMNVDAGSMKEPPTPHPEDSESIECLAVPADGLTAFLREALSRGDGIDSKVVAYAVAREP